MIPSYLDSYPRDYFLKARSNGLPIQTAARKEKRTFATLICWTISYLEIRTKEENMLLYLQKEVLVFKNGLSYIVVFFLGVARIQNLLRLSCVLSLSNVTIKREISTYVDTA